MEKIPKDYNPGKLQQLVEYLENKILRTERKSREEYQDLSQEFEEKLAATKEALTSRIDGKGDLGQVGALPKPQNLKVYELGTFGFAHVEPFYPWKHFGRVTGYDFFGSPNEGFAPQPEPYSQAGIHRGGNGSLYLNTESADPEVASFVLSGLLIGKTLENVTQGTSGLIVSYGLKPKYRIFATGVTWDVNDAWRIRNYPTNKLFNLGSQAIFLKRLGNFYVRARTRGKGHAYSDFTDEVTSVGISSTEEIDSPEIVMPVHNCKKYNPADTNRTCTMGEKGTAAWGLPICPLHDVVPWDEIISGTREIEHYVFFGVEFCTVELQWEAIETERKGVWYDVARGTTETEDTEIA